MSKKQIKATKPTTQVIQFRQSPIRAEPSAPAEKLTLPDYNDLEASILHRMLDIQDAIEHVNLESMVHKLEEEMIRCAFKRHPKDVGRAAIWLGLRSTEALPFIMRRHSTLHRELLG